MTEHAVHALAVDLVGARAVLYRRGESEWVEVQAYNGTLDGLDKIAYGQAQAESRIAALITEVLEGQGLIDRVVEVGLSSPAGYGGARLSPVQRQKLALARALMKRAEIYVFDDPLAPFDSREQALVRGALLEYLAGKSVFWALQNAEWARHFDHVLVLDQGRLVEHGAYEKLATRGHALHRLVSAHEESGSS